MKDLVNSAEYMIQLASNSVIEESRNNFYSDIENFDEYCTAIELLYKSILSGFKENNYSIYIAEILFSTEYNKANFEQQFGNINGYIRLLKLLMNNSIDGSNEEILKNLKEFIEVADTLREEIAISIYQVCLLRMVYSGIVLIDTKFSKKVMDYINNSPNRAPDNRKLYNMISEIINP